MGNIFKKLLGTKDMRILMLGLDAAGKTSTLTLSPEDELICLPLNIGGVVVLICCRVVALLWLVWPAHVLTDQTP